MPACLVRLVAAVFFALVVIRPAAAEAPAATRPPGTDQDGDPLPPGALVRFGSARWRVSPNPSSVLYGADGKTLLVFGSSNSSKVLEILSAGDGRRLGQRDLGRDGRYVAMSIDRGWQRFQVVEPQWAVSPDRRLFAARNTTEDHGGREVLVREIGTGKTVFKLTDESRRSDYVRFTPDGKHLGTVERQAEEGSQADQPAPPHIQLRDVATGREVRRFVSPVPDKDQSPFVPSSFTFSPDGKYLAAVGSEGEQAGVIRLWDVDGKRGTWRLERQFRSAGPVAFSPDGRLLAEVSGGALRLWDTATGKRVRELAAADSCSALLFSPDGTRLVAGGDKFPLRLWDVAAGKEIATLGANVTVAVFSPNGRTLAVGGASGRVCLYDVKTGQSVRVLEGTFNVRENCDANFAAAEQGAGWPLAFSPDGSTLTVPDDGCPIRRWAVATGKEIPPPGENVAGGQALAVSADGKVMASGGRGGVLLWDTATGKFLRRLTRVRGDSAEGDGTPQALTFSSDGKLLGGGWDDGGVAAFDVSAGKPLWRVAGHQRLAWSVTFAAGDSALLSAGFDGQVYWWGATTGRLQRALMPVALPEEEEERKGMTLLTPDARFAIGVSRHDNLQVWELATGKPRRASPFSRFPRCLAPDGRSMVVDGGDSISLADLATGADLRYFRAGTDVRTVVFSPDGRLLVAGCADGTLHAWETATGTPRGRVAAHAAAVNALAFTADGKALVSASTDTTLLLWDAMALFTERTPAKLTEDEFARLWDSLAADDPAMARPALARLRTPQAVAFLKGKLLAVRTDRMTACDELRALRAVELLEGDGGAEARAVLDELAGGAAGRPAEEAKASLRRLAPVRRSDPPARRPDNPREEPLPSGARARLGSLRFQHGAPVCSLRYLPDGKTLLTTINTNVRFYVPLCLWDADTGCPRARLQTQFGEYLRGRPPDGGVSADGRLLVTLEDGNRGGEGIVVRELPSGKRRFNIGIAKESFPFLHFSPDGKTLAAACETTRSIRLYETIGGKQIGELPPPDDGLFSPQVCTFSPDGKFVASEGSTRENDGTVCVWKAVPGAAPLTLPERSLKVGPIAFAPDGKALAVVSVPADGTGKPKLRLWDPATGAPLRDLAEHDAPAEALLFSPDGRLLVCQAGKRARVWDLTRRAELPAVVRGRGIVLLLFAPDGKTLLVGDGKTLSLLDPLTGETRREWKYDPPLRGTVAATAEECFYEAGQGLGQSAAFSPDGKVLAVAAGNGVRRWVVASGAEIEPAINPVTLTALAVSGDGRQVVAGGEGKVVVWDGAAGKVLRVLVVERTADEPDPVAACAALSPDGKLVAAGTRGGRLLVWDGAGRKVCEVQGHAGAVSSLCFLPDGHALVSAGLDGCAVWSEAATGQQLRRVVLKSAAGRPPRAGDKERFRLVVLAPDSRSVAGVAGAVNLWELAGGRVRRTVGGPGGECSAIAFSPDGRRVALASGAVLGLYDAAGGEELRSFAAPWGVRQAAFSPDGRLLVAAGGDGLCLWDAATGTLLGSREGHRGERRYVSYAPDGDTVITDIAVRSLAFSADGRTLATGGSDSTVLLWDVAALVGRGAAAAPSAAEMAALWEALGDEDAAKAYTAQVRLGAHPAKAVALVRERLKPVTAPSAGRLARLVADLESDDFEARQRAVAELTKLGETAEPALREALGRRPSAELRRQAEGVLAKLDQAVTRPDAVRELRAVELLERAGTPEARAVLDALAQGAPGARLTRESAASVRRLPARMTR